MFITKEQVQELHGTLVDEKLTEFANLLPIVYTGIDEKIQKFAELFPNGIEVTSELCEKHPDVFSFGLQGASLLPNRDRKDYSDKVRMATVDCKLRLFIHDQRRPPLGQKRWTMEEIIRYYNVELARIFYEASIT